MDLTIIIVSWNVRELLRQCIRSLDAEIAALPTPHSIETIVVDNASSDDTVGMLRSEFPQVRVIANAGNRGFTRANNQALAIAQGRYVFLLNPDTELGKGALCALLEYMEEHPRVGIAGPRLYYGDGTPQSSRRRFPTLATAMLESTRLQQWFPGNSVLTHFYMLDTRDDETQPVDWINGAAMFVRREVYNTIGGMDERFFMYSEELDWCRRAKEAGWDIVYLASAHVTHYEAKSSDQVAAQRDIYFNSSKVRYFEKYRGPFVAFILRAFLLMMFALMLIEESIKWLLGHKRSLRAARVKAYAQVLRSGLGAADSER